MVTAVPLQRAPGRLPDRLGVLPGEFDGVSYREPATDLVGRASKVKGA